MNANAETNITPSTADIEKRIADERNRLNAELGLQNRLQAQKMPALESGDHDALELIEKNLAGCIDRQSSIENRIRLLTDRLEQSRQRDESKRLDELVANAERARERGIKIITTVYPKLAKSLAAALTELQECEQTIETANGNLLAAKRDGIEPANNCRLRLEGGIADLPTALHQSVSLPSEQPGTIAPAYWVDAKPEYSAYDALARQQRILGEIAELKHKHGPGWRDTAEGRAFLRS